MGFTILSTLSICPIIQWHWKLLNFSLAPALKSNERKTTSRWYTLDVFIDKYLLIFLPPHPPFSKSPLNLQKERIKKGKTIIRKLANKEKHNVSM